MLLNMSRNQTKTFDVTMSDRGSKVLRSVQRKPPVKPKQIIDPLDFPSMSTKDVSIVQEPIWPYVRPYDVPNISETTTSDYKSDHEIHNT